MLEGVPIHRWIRPGGPGPLFGVTFVAGTIRALRRLRPRYDLIHARQALWEATATGLGRHWLGGVPVLVQPAASGYYGEVETLARTKGSAILRPLILRNTAFEAISADIERRVAGPGAPPLADDPDDQRRRPAAVPSRTR